MKPDIRLKKIYEHDIDLLIAEEFVADQGFATLFLDAVGFDGIFEVERVTHSLSEADGESDLFFLLVYPDCKRALFVEDKIDAVTMPQQYQRYLKRAESGRLRGDYDEYRVILTAPEEYLREHRDDPDAAYLYTLSYERLLMYFEAQQTPRSSFKAAVVRFAIAEKKNGYCVIEDVAVTDFWKKMRDYCRRSYPQLMMIGKDEPKGSAAAWPEFRTVLNGVKVIYKSQNGYVDLEFPRYGHQMEVLKRAVGDGWNVCRTGGSAVVRLSDERWKTDFHHPFEEEYLKIDDVLCAVDRLCVLATDLGDISFD